MPPSNSASVATFTHTPPSSRSLQKAAAASSSSASSSAADAAEQDHGNRYLFPFILLTQVIVYIEAGAVPALLNEIGDSFHMSFWTLGLMGGIGYLCLSVGCPVATYAFRTWDVPYVLGCSILLNAITTAVFAITPGSPEWTWLLVASRGIIGFSQAFPIIFFPLWCDAHAPPERKTSWLSYVQGGVVIGIFVGYAVATVTFLFPTCGAVECWRVPFILQVLLTLPLAILAFAIPKEHCNIRAKEDEGEEREEEHLFGHAVSKGNSPLMPLLKEKKKMLQQQQQQQQQLLLLQQQQKQQQLQHQQHQSRKHPSSHHAHTSSTDSHTGGHTGEHDGLHVAEFEEAAAGLVANVGAVLGPHVILDPSMPSHPRGSHPNSNPSPWPTPAPPHKHHAAANGNANGNTHEAQHPHSLHSYGAIDEAGGASSLSTDESAADGLVRIHSDEDDSAVLLNPSSSSLVSGGEDDSPRSWHTMTTGEGLGLLASNTVFVATVLSLSFGYFCVIGLSYWSTTFMIAIRHGNPSEVRLGFILCALTAPIGGVLAGGYIVDRAGGYSGLVQRTEALKCCCCFLLIGSLFAGPAAVLTDLLASSAAIWIVLFFGSATLPPATGVMLNSVHPDMRPFAAAVATISFNVIGYFGGPLLSGAVMTYSSFLWGYRVILWAAIPCLLCMTIAWLTSRTQRKARKRAHQRRAEHEAAAAATQQLQANNSEAA